MNNPQTYLFNSSTIPALVNGQVLGIQVDQNAGVVTVSNQSPNLDILISLDATAPAVTTTPQGGWPYVVHQNDRMDIPVPGRSQTGTPTGQYWQGKIWLLPIVNNASLSLTGVLPTIGNVWVTTHTAGEPIPAYQAATGAVSQVGQQRVVNLPIAFTPQAFLFLNPAVPFDLIVYSYPLTPTQKAMCEATFYMSLLETSLQIPAAGTDAIFNWQLFVDEYLSGVLGASILMLNGTVSAGQVAAGPVYSFPYQMQSAGGPQALGVAGGPGAFDTIKLRFHVPSKAGVCNINLNVSAFPDFVNATPVGTYGNFTANVGPF